MLDSIMKLLILFSLFINLFALNHLQYEESPYLQQHKNDPVNWYALNDTSLQLAKKEHKPIFLSIGYSTCHWCHVMQQESFANQKIAKILNQNYISIKVDREEMPHIDAYYQKLYKVLKKHSGGWPLTAILTEDAEAFFIAGYIPNVKKYGAEGLMTLLPKIAKEYKSNTSFFIDKAQNIKKEMQNKKALPSKQVEGKLSQNIFTHLQNEYDELEYGFSSAPKFPEVSKIELLFLLDTNLSKSMAYETLDAMAKYGLYDHIEGGFFRYSRDSSWEIPHFEKMLYTNAELINIYSKAYLQSKNELYKKVVQESINMIEKRFMQNNLFFSASSADTNHHEGTYFTFTKKEIVSALKKVKNRPQLIKKLQLNQANFEGRFHINIYNNLSSKEFALFKKELLKIRQKKVYPFIDKKINTAWNAMMIKSLFIASNLDLKYQVIAQNALEALLRKMYLKNTLYHQTLINTTPSKKALLEDYSFIIAALIEAYEKSYKESYLQLAKKLTHKVLKLFYSQNRWYLSSDKFRVEADFNDKYYKAPLNQMLMNLLQISALEGNREYTQIVKQSIEGKDILASAALSQIALALKKGFVTLKSTKSNLEQNRILISKLSYPFIVTKVKKELKEYLACTLNQCFAIDNNVSKVITIIEGRK